MASEVADFSFAMESLTADQDVICRHSKTNRTVPWLLEYHRALSQAFDRMHRLSAAMINLAQVLCFSSAGFGIVEGWRPWADVIMEVPLSSNHY
jgi:hypothetical protein